MMTGLPGDTPEKDIETAKKIIALRPDGVRIYPTVIVRDTALYDMWQAGSYPEHTVEQAVQAAATCARKGDVVLFSPGTSSFDQFRSYVHRGETFRAAVKQTLHL